MNGARHLRIRSHDPYTPAHAASTPDEAAIELLIGQATVRLT